MKVSNICYILNKEDKVLLQKKARGFGEGKWNGPGGKSEAGETPEDAVRREVKEETGIILGEINKAALLEFIYLNKASCNFISYVYICNDFKGVPVDMGEGELRWFKKEEVPLDYMWDDDKYWLLDVLNGKFIKKRFYFDYNNKVMKYEDL